MSETRTSPLAGRGVSLDYAEMRPPKELRPYVVCFWMIASPHAAVLRDRTLPDGCQEVIFNLATAVTRRERDGRASTNPSVELVGQMTRAYDVTTSGRNEFFGVKFLPHGVSPFVDAAMAELCDQSIAAGDVFGAEVMRVGDEVLRCPTLEWFAARMSAMLMRRLAVRRVENSAERLAAEAVRRLVAEREPTPITQLAADLGVGERRLQLVFKRHVGLSPKLLSRMVRFQRTLPWVRDPGASLTDVAYACGYFDQAHFVHEFVEFAGCSPSAYRNMKTPLTGFFVRPDALAYLAREPA
jgi:AraC-like DNA-binding protein